MVGQGVGVSSRSRIAAALLIGVATGTTAAAAPRHRHRTRAPVPTIAPVPSVDADQLARLAPPSSEATAAQTYGDAGFARSRYQRSQADLRPYTPIGTVPLGIDACEPRSIGPAGYRCLGDPTRPGYGQYYAYTPANATSPLVPRFAPGAEPAILPPVSELFQSLNALRYDPHN